MKTTSLARDLSHIAYALVLGTLVAACDDTGAENTNPGPDAGTTNQPDAAVYGGSCTLAATADWSICIDYAGASWSPSSVQSSCSVQSATYGSGHCSSSALTGTCSLANTNLGTGFATTIYYYPPTTLDTASGACATQGGSFTIGSNASCRSGVTSVPNGVSESRTAYEMSSVPYGGSCVSETQMRLCTNGTFGSWTGTYTNDSCNVDPGSCGGSATSCSGLAQVPCGQQGGCSWSSQGSSCGATSPDFAYNCSNFTYIANASSVCPTIAGCYWTGSACAGGVQYCEDKNSTQCSALMSQGFPCAWGAQYACSGVATACASFSDETACGAQSGCSWQ